MSTLLLFFVGAGLAFATFESYVGVGGCLLAAAGATAAYALCGRRAAPGGPLKGTRRLAAVTVALLHLLWLYLAASFGLLLAWSTPPWARLLAAALAALTIATIRRPWRGLRIPLALPLGVWIAVCLLGWEREQGNLRCDDYLRALRDPAVRLAVATTRAADGCTPGTVLSIGRYPRMSWESPDGTRYLVTTQVGHTVDLNRLGPQRLSGSVCEASVDDAGTPRCLGTNKGHGFAEAPGRDELFIGSYADEGHRGAVLAVPRSNALRELRRADIDGASGLVVYDPGTDRLTLFFAEADRMLTLDADSLSPLGPSVPVPASTNELRFEPARREGLLCGAWGARGLATAFRVSPFAYRRIGRSALAWVALSWGCDWDPARRLVWAALPNLGLLAVLDYDSGRLLRASFAGFGLRSVALDAARRRVYLTDFLRGDVVEVDADDGRVLRRFFAGRFVREARLSRDGNAILVTSNLGLLRIAIDGGAAAGAAAR